MGHPSKHMDYWEYGLQRLLLFIPILFGVSVFAFLLVHLVPGSPAHAMLGVQATPELVDEVERELGLHQPIYIQFVEWYADLFQGDLGHSFSERSPVSEILYDRFWVSFQLVLMTLPVAVFVAIPISVVAAMRKHSAVDYLSIGVGVVGVSIPTFFSAIVLMAIFGVSLEVLPVSGYVSPREDLVESIRHMVLPVLSLSLVAIAVIMRMMRSAMLENMGQDYLRFLRAKGLTRRSIIFVHALKNSMIPVVTIIGLQFGYMLGGAVVIEEIFALPGIGRTVLDGVLQRDYPLVQGSILLIALWFATVNLITDLTVAYLDPRIMEDTG